LLTSGNRRSRGRTDGNEAKKKKVSRGDGTRRAVEKRENGMVGWLGVGSRGGDECGGDRIYGVKQT
jgi:hypothetical protein